MVIINNAKYKYDFNRIVFLSVIYLRGCMSVSARVRAKEVKVEIYI